MHAAQPSTAQDLDIKFLEKADTDSGQNPVADAVLHRSAQQVRLKPGEKGEDNDRQRDRLQLSAHGDGDAFELESHVLAFLSSSPPPAIHRAGSERRSVPPHEFPTLMIGQSTSWPFRVTISIDTDAPRRAPRPMLLPCHWSFNSGGHRRSARAKR